MRLLPALLATLLASTTVIQTAAACGGGDFRPPQPRVLAVSTHGMMIRDHWGSRSFIVLEQPLKVLGDGGTWKALAPGTYDGTQIKTLAALPSALEVTLVGASGTRVVKTAKQVGLSRSWQIGWDQQRVALEVPVRDEDQFSIAIVGRATDAKWHELSYSEAPASTKWWLGKRRVGDTSYVGLRTMQGSSAEIIQFDLGGTSQFVVRDGDAELGAAVGQPLGIVTTGGRSFVAFSANHQVGLLELPASAAPAATPVVTTRA